MEQTETLLLPELTSVCVWSSILIQGRCIIFDIFAFLSCFIFVLSLSKMKNNLDIRNLFNTHKKVFLLAINVGGIDRIVGFVFLFD